MLQLKSCRRKLLHFFSKGLSFCDSCNKVSPFDLCHRAMERHRVPVVECTATHLYSLVGGEAELLQAGCGRFLSTNKSMYSSE